MPLDQLKEDRRPAPHAACTFGALAPALRTGSTMRALPLGLVGRGREGEVRKTGETARWARRGAGLL